MKLTETSLDRPRMPRWSMIALVLVVIVVGVWAIVTITADDKAPVNGDGNSAAPGDQNLFAPDPVFDTYQRVAYVPLDERGVILNANPVGSDARPATSAPDGIMLQRVNGDMTLPFSTSDGPTGFNEAGVATGFTHTAQGAALAAMHYFCWEMRATAGAGNPEQIEALRGLVEPESLLTSAIERMTRGEHKGTQKKVECAPSILNVKYDSALTRVYFGYSASPSASGETRNLAMWVDLVWRANADEPLGGHWVDKLPTDGEGNGRVGTDVTFDTSKGWVTWFK